MIRAVKLVTDDQRIWHSSTQHGATLTSNDGKDLMEEKKQLSVTNKLLCKVNSAQSERMQEKQTVPWEGVVPAENTI